jgi:hypothetical protein
LTIALFAFMFFSFDHCIVCLYVYFFWPLHCLSLCLFLLTIALFVFMSFSFDHCIVCLYVFFFWPLHCLSACLFLLTIALFVFLSFLNLSMKINNVFFQLFVSKEFNDYVFCDLATALNKKSLKIPKG